MAAAAHGSLAAAVASISPPRISFLHFPSSKSGRSASMLHGQGWPSIINARPKLSMDVQLLDACVADQLLTNPCEFLTKGHDRLKCQDEEDLSTSRVDEQTPAAMAKMMGMLAAIFVALSSMGVGAAEGAGNLDPRAETNFQRSCAGCHAGGGNILQPSATLFLKDLEKNGLSSVDELYRVTYSGKNRMPGYGEKCTPRGQCTFGPRLSDEDIRALAELVRRKAEEGWIR